MVHNAIGIIPARGGSKRIPNKNIVDLNGIPLIVHSFKSAKLSKALSDVYVSTEDKKIAGISKKNDFKVIDRPKNLSTDSASTLSVLKQVVKYLEEKNIDFDIVVLLQPTCPFRKTSTIDNGVEELIRNWAKLDAVFSVKKTKFPPNWLLRVKGELLEFMYKNDFIKIRGQDLQTTYEFDGVLYVIKKELIKKAQRYPFARGRTGFVKTGKIESIDIDDFEDLEIARAILR